ncbi:hypothetical protein MUN74_12270 [Agromyces endophyticus]|uniref:hypothetical protein n=1 Tax=Agromyces sp. H17E-10 TaxID=2932244 RepID=UPI001FD3B2C0|nr:hypothetical protein [Agromyces sp. H17E-10]UOQ88067.1 hypothetical protein MUN74_12270 [Agromyces sp. H17E-10]
MGFDSSRAIPTAHPAVAQDLPAPTAALPMPARPTSTAAAAIELVASKTRAAEAARRRLDQAKFTTDVKDLELRLAIIDDRFERLATRPEDLYDDWRRDTVGRIRALAQQARRLEESGALEPHLRDRVAALLLTLRHRLGALDARRTALHPHGRRGR